MNLFPSHQLHTYISPFFLASPLHPIQSNQIFRENNDRMRKSISKAPTSKDTRIYGFG
ncbi:unnamed protein product [Brassica rapa]|uniref:Uncharacterized protein n=1 Tax=Brassica campestris TaxID=3711 RepID=A0A3P5YJP6_BRACM|nr:unnamed protein product [Brassica rapa]VDC61051.1 unnamed protein product [Brassica rapa]